jgi:hypothetical protein
MKLPGHTAGIGIDMHANKLADNTINQMTDIRINGRIILNWM